ncbi:hypothetical protein O7635_36105 [Asanoa sp. WMMD1127]|uniref:hypothetical protein n=1 Tax=Asanoa sp. WMMD1127 TaxID=3016107 RepID=UPI00241777B0|nr:hypothetical protein [Asanoa sp. WMMD1127]MDG4827300.1 hypothetical protein [Asanoa sp. WMMD1127]
MASCRGPATYNLAHATDIFLVAAGVGFAVALLVLRWLARRAASPLALVRVVGAAAVATVLGMMVSSVFLMLGAPGGLSWRDAVTPLPGYGLLLHLGVRCLRLTRPRGPGAGRPSRRPAPVPSA